MLTLTISSVIIALLLSNILSDYKLMAACSIFALSSLISIPWSLGVENTLLAMGLVDMVFCVLFGRLSNAYYGFAMSVMLLSQSIASLIFYIDYITDGGFVYRNYGAINEVITLAQALILLIIGGLRARNIGFVSNHYHIRFPSLADMVHIKARNQVLRSYAE